MSETLSNGRKYPKQTIIENVYTFFPFANCIDKTNFTCILSEIVISSYTSTYSYCYRYVYDCCIGKRDTISKLTFINCIAEVKFFGTSIIEGLTWIRVNTAFIVQKQTKT